MGNLTYLKPNGEWGIEGVDLSTLPPKVYGALCKLMKLEHETCSADSELEAYRALGTIDRLRDLVQRDTVRACREQIINHGMDITGEYDIDYNLICPSCGATVGDAQYGELNGPFCHCCGQRVDLPSRRKAELKGESDDDERMAR